MLDSLPPAKPLEPIHPDAEGYCRCIWEEHVKRRGTEFPGMSSAEFSLLLGWLQEGIPLRIVLRGIADTPKTGSGLFYYQHSVREAFAFWLKATAQLR